MHFILKPNEPSIIKWISIHKMVQLYGFESKWEEEKLFNQQKTILYFLLFNSEYNNHKIQVFDPIMLLIVSWMSFMIEFQDERKKFTRTRTRRKVNWIN